MTLAELVAMVREHDLAAWDHTAKICEMLANINRDEKQRPTPYTLEEFHPIREVPAGYIRPTRARRGGLKVTADNIAALKVFVPAEIA